MLEDDAPHQITVVHADDDTIFSTPVDTHRSTPTIAPSAPINALGPNHQCPQQMQESSTTPDTNFWPPNIVELVKSNLRMDSPPPTAPLFIFKLSQEAAHRNYCMLKRFNMSIGKALGAQSNSPLGYGSEFKKAATLQPLLHLHPNWPQFKKLLNEGSDWPLKEIPRSSQTKDAKEALGFENHKGASLTPELLTSLINNNVMHGFAIPFPPGILFVPLNIQEQRTPPTALDG
jgi:hypothetical protein